MYTNQTIQYTYIDSRRQGRTQELVQRGALFKICLLSTARSVVFVSRGARIQGGQAPVPHPLSSEGGARGGHNIFRALRAQIYQTLLFCPPPWKNPVYAPDR